MQFFLEALINEETLAAFDCFFTYCLLYAGGKYKIDIVFEISVQVLYEKLQLGWQYYSYKSDLPGMMYLVYAKQNAKLKETEQGRSWQS